VANITDFDNFIKMDDLGMNCEKTMIESVIRALMRGANCVEGSCFSLYFMLTVYEVDGEGKTGGKYYWLALVLKYKLAYCNFPCLSFDWREGGGVQTGVWNIALCAMVRNKCGYRPSAFRITQYL
jgi:hypothetical protein